MLFFVVGHSLETVGNAHYMCSTERAKKKRKSVRPPTLSFILQLQPTTPPSTRQENKEFVFVLCRKQVGDFGRSQERWVFVRAVRQWRFQNLVAHLRIIKRARRLSLRLVALLSRRPPTRTSRPKHQHRRSRHHQLTRRRPMIMTTMAWDTTRQSR